MEFKVGDTVRVKTIKKLKEENKGCFVKNYDPYYDRSVVIKRAPNFVSGMIKHIGKKYRIENLYGYNFCEINDNVGNSWIWATWMLEKDDQLELDF